MLYPRGQREAQVVSRKQGRKHHHRQPEKDHPSGIQGNLPSGAVDANAPCREDVQETGKHNEEPPKMTKRPDWMTIFTGILALFAVLSFGALWIQLQDVRDNFIKDQRPYVWVTPSTPTFKDQETIKWDFNYSNYGRSPAFNVRSCGFYAWGVGAWNEIRDFSLADCAKAGKGNIEGTGSVVPPGYPEVTTMVTHQKFREDVDRTILSIDGVLMNENVLEYEDSFGNRYRSLSCVYRLATGAIAHCDKYNYIKQIK